MYVNNVGPILHKILTTGRLHLFGKIEEIEEQLCLYANMGQKRNLCRNFMTLLSCI